MFGRRAIYAVKAQSRVAGSDSNGAVLQVSVVWYSVVCCIEVKKDCFMLINEPCETPPAYMHFPLTVYIALYHRFDAFNRERL